MKIKTITLILGANMLFCAIPGLSQQELSNNQPVTKLSSAIETRLQAKLKLDYSKGLIDATQLAQMQRDFDAILVHEDDFKSRGMTSGGRAKIDEQLAQFEARLDKAAGVSTTAQAESVSGPRVDKSNAGLSNVAPTR